ncbi:MAG TPA: hypothetical protein DF698_00885, partial [Candidatus Atribacteria bacterium]|nr:hypothetical protein [Candidatus Atribacteria bacterium]
QEDFANDKFVSFMVKDYKELIQVVDDVEDLKQFLFVNLGEDVFNWHERLNEVNNLIKRWVNEFYQRKAFRKVLSKIDNMPETQVKNMLKELAKNPLVGNLLLRRGEEIIAGNENLKDD